MKWKLSLLCSQYRRWGTSPNEAQIQGFLQFECIWNLYFHYTGKTDKLFVLGIVISKSAKCFAKDED